VQAHSTRLIKPHALLPFTLDERQARDAFRKWLHGLWFAPNEVRRIANGPGPMAGVYVPHWTYDASTTTRYTGQRGVWYYTTETYTTSENGRPVTRTRQVRHTAWHHAQGTVYVAFDDVIVPGSDTLPAEYRPTVSTEDLRALVPFNEAYLAGFRAEAYAVGLEQGFQAACGLMQPTIDNHIRRDIGGDEQRIGSKATDYADVTFKHLLLPLWISVFQYRDRAFRFTVDARTGVVHGERPWSKVKIAVAIIAALVLVAVIAIVANASS